MKFTLNNLEETRKVAHNFVEDLVPLKGIATIVGLYGDLGAGKTFFASCVAEKLKVKDQIVSPTFVIEKIYSLPDQKFTHLIHIDAYRLEKSEELLKLGWEKIISDPNNLIMIEWPEKVADIMPKHIKIEIKHQKNETEREISIDL